MPSPKKAIEKSIPFDLDGRTLEGGGQLLRLAVGMSALTGKSLCISHIRGNRSGSGGLKAQHLACVKWLAEARITELEGAEIKSQRLLFRPGSRTAIPPTYRLREDEKGVRLFECCIDIGSPGSIALALQAVLPYILFSPPLANGDVVGQRQRVRLTILGGTNVTNSPSYEYVAQVLIPTLATIGLPLLEPSLDCRGWSTGGSSIGRTSFTIPLLKAGEKLAAFDLCPSDIGAEGSQINPSRIKATVIAPESMESDFRWHLCTQLQEAFSTNKEKLDISFENSRHEKRVYLILVATVVRGGRDYNLGSDELLQGMGYKKPDQIVSDMVERVIAKLTEDVESGACVDRHMMDQLVVFQALAEGKSDVCRGLSESGGEIGQSLHAETAEWISEVMVGAKLENGKGRGAGIAAGVNQEDSGSGEVSELSEMVQRMGLHY